MDTKKLTDKFKGRIKEQEYAEGMVHDAEVPALLVEKSALVDACRFLRDEMEFDSLSFLTAVDYPGNIGLSTSSCAIQVIRSFLLLKETESVLIYGLLQAG